MAFRLKNPLTGKFEVAGASPDQVKVRGPLQRNGRFVRTTSPEDRGRMLGAKVPPEVKNTIDRLAAEQGISTSEFMGQLVREELERLQNGPRAPARDSSDARPAAGAPRNLWEKIHGRAPDRPARKKSLLEKLW